MIMLLINGFLLSQGIYSADTFAKSKGYCCNYNPKSNLNCALLCEVSSRLVFLGTNIYIVIVIQYTAFDK